MKYFIGGIIATVVSVFWLAVGFIGGIIFATGARNQKAKRDGIQ